MSQTPQILLTERDYAILRGIAVHRPVASAAYFALLDEKLASAVVIAVETVESDLATVGSLIRYRVGEGKPLEHKLILHPGREGILNTVSIRTVRGLALLGLQEGQSVSLAKDDGSVEVVELDFILFQPEVDGPVTRRQH